VACDILLESSRQGIQLCFSLISIGGLHAKLWACKVMGVPIVRILGLPLGSPETKCHLDVGLMKRHKIYYKREGDGFPQVWTMMNLVNPSLFVVHPNTKNVLIMH
jgi:hypothetical protein